MSMGSGSRWTLAIVTALCGVCFAMLPIISPIMPHPLGLLGCAAFCLAIACVCAFPRTAPVLGRLIGATLFVLCVCFAIDHYAHPLTDSHGPPDNALGPVVAMVIFGLPGGYFAVMGRSPSWSELRYLNRDDEPSKVSDDPGADGSQR